MDVRELMNEWGEMNDVLPNIVKNAIVQSNNIGEIVDTIMKSSPYLYQEDCDFWLTMLVAKWLTATPDIEEQSYRIAKRIFSRRE